MTAPCWDGPGRLVSLWDLMQNVRLGVLAGLFENLSDNIVHARRSSTAGERLVECGLLDAIKSNLRSAVAACARFGTMPQSLVYAERLVSIAEWVPKEGNTDEQPADLTVDFANKLDVLLERMRDELNSTTCFLVTVDRAKFFNNKQPFGEKVEQIFPKSIVDIEEASKCLGCARGTACVFHLMRVMEDGLRTVASVLGITYAPSWESYIKQIEVKLDLPWKKKSRLWRKQEPFFRDVLAHLHAVKVAWRNPTMHIVNHYTPEQAEDVFNAVRGFMRHLASALEVSKAKKGGLKLIGG
jgi:hypothetical protein